MAIYTIEGSTLNAIANAIRTKCESTEQISVSDMANQILSFEGGGVDMSDATANEGHILSGKTAYVADGKVTGTMANNGSVSKTLDAETTSYTISQGYHTGSGKVQISTEERTVTPTKETQTITPTSGKVISSVQVGAIPSSYITTTDATATSDDILAGETAYVNGAKVTGTIEVKDSSDLTVSGATVTVPSGYYDGQTTKSVATATRADTTMTVTADDTNDKLTITASNNQGTGYVTGANKTATKTVTLTASGATVTASDGSKSVSKSVTTATQATPSVSVDSNGLITASATQSEGYVSAGTKSGTKQLTTQAAKTITPTKSSQTAVAKNVYTTGAVTVAAIPDEYITTSDATAAAGEILSGETAYVNGSKVTGTMKNNGAVSKTLDTSTTSYTVPSGYHNGSGKVQISTETKSATPTKSAQTITPTSGKVLSSVSVAAIPSQYITTTDATAQASEILSGETAYVNGSKVTGTMKNNGAISSTMDGINTKSVTVPAGYTSGGTVSLDSTIDDEVDAQTDLINQIATALEGKAAGGGIDTSDATAAAGDILNGKTAYVNGEKITGTIASKTASNLTVNGATVTVPAGHYATQATKSVATGSAKTPATTVTKNPTISVNSSGKITASVSGTQSVTPTVTAGYVSSGTAGTITVSGSATKQLTTQAAQTITPGTSNKTIASGRYLTGTQTIKGDANLVAGNIKSGVSIFGVTGTYAGTTEDLDSVITELETKVSTLNTTLDGKAAGGGSSDGGSSLATYRVRYDDGGMCNLCYYVTLNNGILQIIPLGADQLYGDYSSTDFEVDGVVEGGTFAVQCGDSIDATCTNAELLNVYEDSTWGNYIYTYLITGDAEIIG